jgi:hypothetical protein
MDFDLGLPGTIALGGRVPWSYIWAETAEKQPGRFAPVLRNRNQFGRPGAKNW